MLVNKHIFNQMSYFKPFTSIKRNNYVRKRLKETKFGQVVSVFTNNKNIYDQLLNKDVDFVIFGIAEDIGVSANLGKAGTKRAWDVVIKYLLNIQANDFNHAEKVFILGHFEFIELQDKIETLDQSKSKDLKKIRAFVDIIDNEISYLISLIISAGKTPIIIGGGHNNSYGNIKGTALALKKAINVINFDAHHDFRPMEGRHSGNGFSYAFNEGFLKRYFIFGLHEDYISKDAFKTLNRQKPIFYRTYEDIELNQKPEFQKELNTASKFVEGTHLGIEVDLDAIENFPSSAMTPSGFSANQARQFVKFFGSKKSAAYLHICEAAPSADNEAQVGKMVSYLISDFIKAQKGID